MTSKERVVVIGGGLAGSEAAWQLASEGFKVDLYEMRSETRRSPAHHTDRLAELVCSNSMGSFDGKAASALLKEEMKRIGAKLLNIAWECRVPAGNALAVDREGFAQTVTDTIYAHPNITVHREEFPNVPESDQVTVICTGPLTSDSLANSIKEITGTEALHFFDAAAPILTRESIDESIVFGASRYGKGDGVYLNCPMNKEQYEAFWTALTTAERIELKDFEKNTPFFESCLPVEVIASRGIDTLRFGPMKPVGLDDPRTGRRPWAVVQLRQDNAAANLFNIVGFQTNLKWGDQKRVFRMIPGLENAEFVRLGVMHRNTYLDSPKVLEPTLQLKARPNVFFGGQLTGVEGYTESMATGLIAAKNAARLLRGEAPLVVPDDTMIGSLIRYITHPDQKNLQPINANWGIINQPPDVMALKKDERRPELAKRALKSIATVFGVTPVCS